MRKDDKYSRTDDYYLSVFGGTIMGLCVIGLLFFVLLAVLGVQA